MKLFFSILFTLTIFFSYAQAPQGSIVAQHGRLQVSGPYVGNQYNQKISLAGNSLFWSNAKWDGAPFYNAETVNHLVDEWNTSLIRIAMGVEEDWSPDIGYIADPETELAKVKTVVDAAIAKGIYVIIDWHSHYAHLEQSEAIGFFQEMATLYGTYDNVIYEIFNEPKFIERDGNVQLQWSAIKAYAEAVIAAIRNIDPDNLIIVGTPAWSGGNLVGKPNHHHSVGPADDPINDNNVAYALHYYADYWWHYQDESDYKKDAKEAMDKGIAIFASEWGTIGINGTGSVNYWQTEKWTDFLKENYISHANWSVGHKDQGHCIVNPQKGVQGLINDDLTESGRLMKDYIKNWNVPPVDIEQNPSNGSLRLEAENATLVGVTTSSSGHSNISNGEYVTGMDNDGDKIVFSVDVPQTGIYNITIRYACNSYKENYIYVNDVLFQNMPFLTAPTFNNASFGVDLNQGNNTFTIEKHWGWMDVDYIEIFGLGNEEPEQPQPNETIRFEAEYGQPTGVVNQSNTSASNGEYVTDFHDDGDKLTANINVEQPGMYQLKIGYRSTSGDKKNDIYLNNTFLGNIEFPQSSNFTEKIMDNYYFDAGQNTIEFVKSWGWMDVDYFELVASENQNTNTTNNICDRTLQVSYNTTAKYYVANTINSDATVLENNSAEFIGIQQINLDNEFTVKKGARFFGSIEECTD